MGLDLREVPATRIGGKRDSGKAIKEDGAVTDRDDWILSTPKQGNRRRRLDLLGTLDGLQILARGVDDAGEGSTKCPGRATDRVHADEDSGLFGLHIAEAPREESRADKQAESHDGGRERWPQQRNGRHSHRQAHLSSKPPGRNEGQTIDTGPVFEQHPLGNAAAK
jgi:hypothetical protein